MMKERNEGHDMACKLPYKRCNFVDSIQHVLHHIICTIVTPVKYLIHNLCTSPSCLPTAIFLSRILDLHIVQFIFYLVMTAKYIILQLSTSPTCLRAMVPARCIWGIHIVQFIFNIPVLTAKYLYTWFSISQHGQQMPSITVSSHDIILTSILLHRTLTTQSDPLVPLTLGHAKTRSHTCTNVTRRRRKRQRILKSTLRNIIQLDNNRRVLILIPITILADRRRSRLLGGALTCSQHGSTAPPQQSKSATTQVSMPCLSSIPSACMIASTPTTCPNGDSGQGAVITPNTCFITRSRVASLEPTSPHTGPPTQEPTSPPTGPPTTSPTSPPTGTPTIIPLVSRAQCNFLRQRTHTKRHGLPLSDTDDITPLTSDEDWYPIYLLQASKLDKPTDASPHPRKLLSKSEFADMTTFAWMRELQAMGINMQSPSQAISQLLPEAQRCSSQYSDYNLPNIDFASLTLEEALCHIRIVHRRTARFIRKRKQLQRKLSSLYRCKRHPQSTDLQVNIDSSLLELHKVRSAIVDHNSRHQALQRKTKALTKSTARRMPRQVFVPVNLPDIPTYNRYAILSEEDTVHHRTKSWHDFIHQTITPTTVGAIGKCSKPVPLTQTPPRQQPMQAMAQLRRDLTTYGSHVAHQAPAHTHDVRGWYLEKTSRQNTTLTVATWNINGISAGAAYYKAQYIAMIMQQDHIDVMICPDSRHTSTTVRALKKHFVTLLGAGTKTYFSKDDGRLPGEPGGIAIIIGPKWGPSYIGDNSRTDFSGQGVLTRIHLRTETGFLAIYGTYWPERPYEPKPATSDDLPPSADIDSTANPDRPVDQAQPTATTNSSDGASKPTHRSTATSTLQDSGKLWHRLLEYRKQQKAYNPDPILYLQDLTLTWMSHDRLEGCNAIILGGDLNSRWAARDKGGQRVIHKWCEDNYLINGPRLIHDKFAPPPDPHSVITLQFITMGHTEWSKGTWIDHLLHAGDPTHIAVHGAFNALGADLDDVSDHKPLWASYITAPPADARVVTLPRPPKRPELPRHDQRQIAEYKSRISEVLQQLPRSVDTPEEAEEALEFASLFSVQLT